MAIFEKVLLWLDRIMRWALDAMIILMAGLLLVLMNYAVFARFVLNSSVSWGEELPAHILAALTFIGAAYLTRTNEHLGFDGVLRLFHVRVQKAILVLNLSLIAAFGAMLAWYGGIAALSFAGRMLISVDLPVMLFRGAMPVGGALIAMIALVRLLGLLTGRLGPENLIPESDH
jgi:TRAP-type C4-dicarboxylate transport system permease small subunit